MRHLLPILLLFIATNVQATTFIYTYLDPDNEDAHPIQMEVWGEELHEFWAAASTMDLRDPWEVPIELPEEWDCHHVRARFLGVGGYSAYSNIVATPEGCVPTEHVPEPGGLGLLAGIGLLGLLKAAREKI